MGQIRSRSSRILVVKFKGFLSKISFTDVEMLKMDINEERQCETVKIKNRKNVATVDTTKTQELAKKLSTIEKEDLANK